ncbi:MAG TPA: hypothetical protein VEK15_18020 [Vicinamibacteria bacterium]|nr:hypothetical protein [Vicinamibacteria bacterium]
MKATELAGFSFGVLFVVALASALPQKTIQSEVVELTAKIRAIDHDYRLVTLVSEDGEVETIYAGPEVKRFDELKVGDTVTFRVYESLVSQIRKAGEAPPSKSEGTPTLVRGTGPKPSGMMSQQMSATVTIKAIDPAVPAVTVVTEDGSTMSFKVDDKKLVEGVKVGDKVDITYTAALMITVE